MPFSAFAVFGVSQKPARRAGGALLARYRQDDGGRTAGGRQAAGSRRVIRIGAIMKIGALLSLSLHFLVFP